MEKRRSAEQKNVTTNKIQVEPQAQIHGPIGSLLHFFFGL